MNPRKPSVVLICAVAALAMVIGLYLFGRSRPVAATTQATGETAVSTRAPALSAPKPGSPALTQAQADAIGSTFASGETARVAAQLSGRIRAEYEASPSTILTPGESLMIRAADVRVTGVGRAVGLVRSHSAAGSTQWALGLVLENGQWKVLTMVKVGAS